MFERDDYKSKWSNLVPLNVNSTVGKATYVKLLPRKPFLFRDQDKKIYVILATKFHKHQTKLPRDTLWPSLFGIRFSTSVRGTPMLLLLG